MLNARYLIMVCTQMMFIIGTAIETDIKKGVHHRHHQHLTDRTLTLAVAHITGAAKGEQT
jgi:hypothetical protein